MIDAAAAPSDQPAVRCLRDPGRGSYTQTMARGWESKNVESQQEEASRQGRKAPAPTAADLVRVERMRTLELTRNRVAHDLTRATADAHRRMLEAALASLDAELNTLKKG